MHTRERGANAEDTAVRYFTGLGWELLDRNFYIWGGELDLVLRDRGEIVFVEVKSLRAPRDPGEIFESVTSLKLRRIRRTINAWLYAHHALGRAWRFDFAGVILDNSGKLTAFHHFPHAEHCS